MKLYMIECDSCGVFTISEDTDDIDKKWPDVTCPECGCGDLGKTGYIQLYPNFKAVITVGNFKYRYDTKMGKSTQ